MVVLGSGVFGLEIVGCVGIVVNKYYGFCNFVYVFKL